MSRPSAAAQRNLTLTEELEKLEQSITLTLQEIDHNFSRAHRIVTTSILPVVEEYAEHSKNVWEGSKFWKQFFEASANVSLSGYEEPPVDEGTTIEDDRERDATGTPSTSAYRSPTQPQFTPSNRPFGDENLSPSPAQTTPRQPKQKQKQKQQATIAAYSSPYEALKRETLPPKTTTSAAEPDDSTLPSTPRAPFPTSQESPQSSPFFPPSTTRHSTTGHRTPAHDILLHRVLDRNYRIQATPHSTAPRLPQRSKSASERTPKPSTASNKRGRFRDDSDLDSSPAIAAPQLHAEIFDTPARKGRVPGVSILTPARGTSTVGGGAGQAAVAGEGEGWDSDEDEEGEVGEGISPPKTMQFHIPQRRLIKTPAREASKRIVEDLLMTAGGSVTDDLEEDSPSVVRRTRIEEDTF
ncbi:DASH complex subunit ask1 [Puttea exsequens]|nr:DASH complex subunit ask1 [Puttea exsequens]